MLSKNQIKHITALKVKKYREEFSQFIAEGHKIVMDLISSKFDVAGIYASANWIATNLSLTHEKNIPVFETSLREMGRLTALSTPSPVIAVVNMPSDKLTKSSLFELINTSAHQHINSLILALDDIRDPGNMGTIIRTADWFGINTVLRSGFCVDLYNPKVIQATMGSIARVRVITCKLAETLFTLTGSLTLTGSKTPGGVFPVYGAFLEGTSVFSENLTDHGIILIGNESRGISKELEHFVTKKIFIPSFGNSFSGKAESLNASTATAIICAEFRRKQLVINNL